jgi:hypothetical protein
MAVKGICIYASQLASCIGHNRFKKPSDALETVWQRVAPVCFEDALRRNGIKTTDEAVHDILTSNQAVRSLLVRAEGVTSTSTEVAQGYEHISRELARADLTATDRRLVDEAFRRTMYTSYGTRQESAALHKLAARIPCHQDETFYRMRVGQVHGVQVYVGGKIDAISDDGTTVIEIKNRINRLFHKLPLYEIIQVQTYLQLLPATESARLVECLTRHTGDVLMNVVPIERDQAFWDTRVVPKLLGFVSYVLRIIADPREQDLYLQSRRRAALVTQAMESFSEHVSSTSVSEHVSSTSVSEHVSSTSVSDDDGGAAADEPVEQHAENRQDDEGDPQAAQPVAVREDVAQGPAL